MANIVKNYVDQLLSPQTTDGSILIQSKGTGDVSVEAPGTGQVNLIAPDETKLRFVVNGNVFTLPTGAGNEISTISTAQTLSNKTLGITNSVTLLDTLFKIQDNLDNTKEASFQLSPISTGTSIVLTVPPATDTLVGLTATQILTNKTFVAPVLGAATATSINNVTITNPGTSATLTIANTKAINVAGNFSTVGASNLTLTTGGVTDATLPTGTITLVDTTSTQTLSNKSLLYNGSNTIAGALKESILYRTTDKKTLIFSVNGVVDSTTGDLKVTDIAINNDALADELIQVFLDLDLSNSDWSTGGDPTFPQAFVEFTLFSKVGIIETECARCVTHVNNVNGPDYTHINIYTSFAAAAATYNFVLYAKVHNSTRTITVKNLRFIYNKYYRVPTQTFTSALF